MTQANTAAFTKGFRKGQIVFWVTTYGVDVEMGIHDIRVIPLVIQAAGAKLIRATDVTGYIKQALRSDHELFRTLEEAKAFALTKTDGIQRIEGAIACAEQNRPNLHPEYVKSNDVRVAKMRTALKCLNRRVWHTENVRNGIDTADLIARG